MKNVQIRKLYKKYHNDVSTECMEKMIDRILNHKPEYNFMSDIVLVLYDTGKNSGLLEYCYQVGKYTDLELLEQIKNYTKDEKLLFMFDNDDVDSFLIVRQPTKEENNIIQRKPKIENILNIKTL